MGGKKFYTMDNVTNITSSPKIAKKIAKKAFIFAYPMLENYKTMYGSTTNVPGDSFKASFNEIYNEDTLYDYTDIDVVTPNNDTLYSHLWNDLSLEPLVLTIGTVDTNRYFSFQLIDYYTHNFDYIGTRKGDTSEDKFLFAGPNWDGDVPVGIKRSFRSESDINFFLGRTQVLNADDGPNNANAIMDSYTIQTLSDYIDGNGSTTTPPVPERDFISWEKTEGYAKEFINYVNLILTWTKIDPMDNELFVDFEKIGIKEGADPVNFSSGDFSGIKDAISEGVAEARVKINEGIDNLGVVQNGWQRVDAFGTRRFYYHEYLLRASAAMVGLYGNSIEEAFYPLAKTSDGETLDASGDKKYVINFGEEPPVDAFWSVSMYSVNNGGFFIQNELDRYKLGSEDTLDKESGGTFSIYIQSQAPDNGLESNWLPAPEEPFYLIMRLYNPSKSIIGSSPDWMIPPVEVNTS